MIAHLIDGTHLFGGPIVGAAIFTFFQFYLGKHTLFWALAMGVVILSANTEIRTRHLLT